MRLSFIQKIIDKIRRKSAVSIKEIGFGNVVEINDKDKQKIKIRIDGDNNKVVIKKMSDDASGFLNISLYGNNSTIIVDENLYISEKLDILIGQNHPNFGRVNNSKFMIGKDTSIESAQYITFNSNTECIIGNNCMFSYGINIYNTDAHPIFDMETGKVINKIKGIRIGDHCWIGAFATILKNSSFPDNSILGMHSVFSGGGQSHSIYAGNPARCVKENINWDSNGAKAGYIDNLRSEVI